MKRLHQIDRHVLLQSGDKQMIHLSPLQLIRLWSQLEQAYYKDNNYRGDTAEIYAFTLLEHHPTIAFNEAKEGTIMREMQDVRYKQAAATLIKVLHLVEEERGCKIRIDGFSVSAWRKKYQGFAHRVHVTVKPKKK